jgi:hypothetical protein
MKRTLGPVAVGALACIVMLASPGEPTRAEARPKPAKKVSPEDLWLKTSSPTVTGEVHKGCVKFADPEAVVSKGPISRITLYHGAYIYGIRITYGTAGFGDVHGFTELIEGIKEATWVVPDGEGITRVEGEIEGYYVSRLQFFTDGGRSSDAFGTVRGKPFAVSDPAKGTLRTVSGWANLRRHPSLRRALTSMTFHFGAPYFIKSIDYDTAALEAARRDTAPERCASQDFTNRTSVEQTSSYANSVKVVKTTKLTFEQSFNLKLGAKVFAQASAGLVKAGAEASWEVSATATSGQSYSSSKEETVDWTVPVKVPPHTRVVATSTWRKYRVSIPFSYTVAWYEGTRDNIKKEVTLPGLYEDVRVDDLKHDFTESRLE